MKTGTESPEVEIEEEVQRKGTGKQFTVKKPGRPGSATSSKGNLNLSF